MTVTQSCNSSNTGSLSPKSPHKFIHSASSVLHPTLCNPHPFHAAIPILFTLQSLSSAQKQSLMIPAHKVTQVTECQGMSEAQQELLPSASILGFHCVPTRRFISALISHHEHNCHNSVMKVLLCKSWQSSSLR